MSDNNDNNNDNYLLNLVSSNLGSTIVYSTDDLFAEAG